MTRILAVGAKPPHSGALLVAEDRLVEEALRLLEDGERLLIYGRGAWRHWMKVVQEAERRGLNKLLVEALDPREALLAKQPIEKLVAARLTLLNHYARSRVPPVVDVDKRVSRRDVLRAPSRLLTYPNIVYVRNPRACETIPSCPLCTSICPYGALEGRPPVIHAAVCTGCGLCISACPESQIARYAYSEQTLWDYIRLLRPNEPGYTVFACRGVIEKLVEGPAPSAPVVLVPIWCPGDATLRLLLASRSAGLEPVIACSGVAEACGTEGVRRYVETVLYSYTVVTGETPALIESLAELDGRPRVEAPSSEPPVDVHDAAVRGAAGDVGPVSLPLPLQAVIRVDDKCTMCAACMVKCPHGALEIVEGDESRLILNPVACTGCLTCREVCPENALSAEWGWVGMENITLRKVEMVRCSVCGRPFAPRTLVEATARRMRETGIPENVIRETVYICPECRVRRLFEPRG